MEEWSLVYRCKKCGKEFKDLHGGKDIVEHAIMSISSAYPDNVRSLLKRWSEVFIGLTPKIWTVHWCDDGGIGIAELIGAEKRYE